MKIKRICVIGLGYIGLPTACMFASKGIQVLGVDTNQDIITTLNNGGLHLHEPGLHEKVSEVFTKSMLKVSTIPDYSDAFIIAVPTPFYENKKADMQYVTSAANSIVPYLQKGNVVVLESTSPPNTTIDLLKPILEKSGLQSGKDFLLVYSPERVLPGKILREIVENARVIGGINRESAEAGRDLYQSFVKGEIILTDSTTAEMVKLMENTYRDVNIAIANEFSKLADRFGVDIREAIRIANLHPRVKILNPGPGVGGHCISVDPWFLVEAAPDLTKLICTAREVNDGQPIFVVNTIKRIVGNLDQKRICALGLTFKPDVDDVRESPALEIVKMLKNEGAIISAFEPFKKGVVDGISIASDFGEAIKDAELLLMLVGHSEFKNLSPETISKFSNIRVIVDTVNILSDEWNNKGFSLYRLGNGKQWKSKETVQ